MAPDDLSRLDARPLTTLRYAAVQWDEGRPVVALAPWEQIVDPLPAAPTPEPVYVRVRGVMPPVQPLRWR